MVIGGLLADLVAANRILRILLAEVRGRLLAAELERQGPLSEFNARAG